MSIDKIIIIVLGAALVALIYWFFFGKKRTAVSAHGSIAITVNGGYTPEVITIPKGQKTVVTFKRTDPTACLEEVVMGDFGVKKYLPLNEEVSVELNPRETGEFTYNCAMNMYHGKIIVS